MGRGTPQGAPISPLLSNLYMRRFILGVEITGTRETFSSQDRQLCGRLCARQCVHEMRVGPSQPACGGRLQTTLSCGGQEPLVVSVKEKGKARPCQV